MAWDQSTSGKRCIKAHQEDSTGYPYPWLNTHVCIDNTPLDKPFFYKKKAPGTLTTSPSSDSNECNIYCQSCRPQGVDARETCDVCMVYSRDCSQSKDVDFVKVKLITDDGKTPIAYALVDTGSLRNDFISRRLVSKLKLPIREANTIVCTGLDDQCSGAIETITARIQYFNEILGSEEAISLDH